MDLSFFIQPLHPIDHTYSDVLREDMESIILADKLGYKEALVGEHFTDLAEPITSSLMFIARLIAETKNIKLGSGITNLPVYHPVMIAGHVAMIDQMLEGRFIWGISPGGQPSDMEAFGNLSVDRNAKMVESFDQIMELWWGEPPFDVKGNFFRSRQPKPTYPKSAKAWCQSPGTGPIRPSWLRRWDLILMASRWQQTAAGNRYRVSIFRPIG